MASWTHPAEAIMSERDLFIAALQRTDPAERSAWLDQACSGDTEMRQRVERLLDAFAQAGSLLESPLLAPVATVDQPGQTGSAIPGASVQPEGPGTLIGSYKLLERIGE